jgi:hypothetical protein
METTLNIHIEILEKINLSAQRYGISRSEVITYLIKKAIDDTKNPICIGKMIQYQKKSKPEDWHTFHLQVRMDDYEYLLDLRRLLKMSVSLILAYVVEKFLNKGITLNITDNYQFKNYIIAREVIDNIISWKIVWGYPYNLRKYLKY